MQVISSPRRLELAAIAAATFALTVVVMVYAITANGSPTMTFAGPVALVFLGVVTARALRTRVEFDADGGVYHGLVRTRRWSWGQVRFVGRQSAFAFGSTGATPELLLRGGGHLVLVGVADPRHPAAEDETVGRLRAAQEAYRATHPSAAEQLVALLKEPDVSADEQAGQGPDAEEQGGDRRD